MEYKCTLETRHSSKKNKDYQVFVIKVSPTYEIVFYPTNEQLEILRLYSVHSTQRDAMRDIPFFDDDDIQTLNRN